MKSIAEELARLWPERFEFVYSGGPWRVTNKAGEMRLNWLSKPHNAWAFWGPLAEEMCVYPTDMKFPFEHDCKDALLMALASAVVAKVREVKGAGGDGG